MELKKIKGNTYYIPMGTNIGVFQFKDKYTLLIDTGNNNQQARKIVDLLQDNNINIKYIFNTHHHIDHTGGNGFLKENFTGSIIYSSEIEKMYIDNDELFSTILYGGNPMNYFAREFRSTKKYNVDEILNEGQTKINNEKFEVINLYGHSKGHIGIATKDKVCFLGDSLFSKEIIEKYKIPFLFDIKMQFDTYEKIKELEYDYYVLSHSEHIYTRDEIIELSTYNKDNLNYFVDSALELLQQPKTKEQLLEEICILENKDFDFDEYHFCLSTIGAIITYLYDKEMLNYQTENGKLYYYAK